MVHRREEGLPNADPPCALGIWKAIVYLGLEPSANMINGTNINITATEQINIASGVARRMHTCTTSSLNLNGAKMFMEADTRL